MSQILQRLEDETDKICFPIPEVGKTIEAAFPGAGSLTATSRGAEVISSAKIRRNK